MKFTLLIPLASSLFLTSCFHNSQVQVITPTPTPDPLAVTITPGATPNSSAASTPAEPVEGVIQVTLKAGDFFFEPKIIRANVGDKIRLTLDNTEGTHDFVIDALNVKSQQITDGQTAIIEFDAYKPGTFEYYCSVGQHRQMGMVGQLIITAPAR